MSKIDYRLIKQLYLFLAVAEEENFGRAAKRLGMSQPPLTEQIKTLEQSLKLTLFERSRRGTKLSASGKAILPHVQKFVIQMSSLEKVVREVALGQSGVIHIGAITSAMFEVLPNFLEHIKQHYPDVTVFVDEIDSAEAISSLSSGELDLAFVRVDGEIGMGLSSIPLTEDKLGVALPLDHPLVNADCISLRSLQDEALVMPSRRVNPPYFDLLTSACRNHNVNPRILYEVRSVTAQIAYVSCGQGVALVPMGIVNMIPNNVKLVPLKEAISVVTAALVWDPERGHPLVDYGVQWLKEHITDKKNLSSS
ncbi:LysR substrate-binding domain-containing protein [Vibrio pelagius]|uniref:LysR substrate-binding domain-containing protein n=1 Tax=Vibrio pelagius TaxID=28169 RepID=UPI0021C3FE05|nr:LysR substrate-binding domain-containing protein [Vibrio pelagius]